MNMSQDIVLSKLRKGVQKFEVTACTLSAVWQEWVMFYTFYLQAFTLPWARWTKWNKCLVPWPYLRNSLLYCIILLIIVFLRSANEKIMSVWDSVDDCGVCVCVRVSTLYCNIFSNNHSVNCYFLSQCIFSKLSTLSSGEKRWNLRPPSIVVFEDWFCSFCHHAHCRLPKCGLFRFPSSPH